MNNVQFILLVIFEILEEEQRKKWEFTKDVSRANERMELDNVPLYETYIF